MPEQNSFDQFAGLPGSTALSIAGYPFDPDAIRIRDLRAMRKQLQRIPADADQEDASMEAMEALIVTTIVRDHPDANPEVIADAITLRHISAIGAAQGGNA